VERLVDELAGTRIGRTFNPYARPERGDLLRKRLGRYLQARRAAPVLLAGEALGYRGGRISGLPFTSERQLTGAGPAEATATIVHRVLEALGLRERVLLWNVVPTHPGTRRSNRPPSRVEVEAGLPFLERLAVGRRVVAVGRLAARETGAPYVRHPSHGGAQAFAAGLQAVLGLQNERRRGGGAC
jgi:uracil-DNA glycosylase